MAPSSTEAITFLFTDIEGSTRLWEQHPEAMREALARHDASIRQAIESRGGHVFKTIGDAFCAAFPDPTAALDSALIVSDDNVANLAPPFASALDALGIASTLAQVPGGEASKSLDRAVDLYDELVKLRADRHTLVVALGGGVIGDLAGFVAATYARGLPLLMIPTTLLSQVDSSVGGKVGVNHPRAKNIIGAFHQPRLVLIDPETLRTLPDREYRSGLAEIVKTGVALDADLFRSLEAGLDAIRRRDPALLEAVVATCCAAKARIVERDEREETGLRMVLNYGHTIGHALEALSGYRRWLHGEAVAIGMAAAAQMPRIARRLYWVTVTCGRGERSSSETAGPCWLMVAVMTPPWAGPCVGSRADAHDPG